MLEYIIYAVIGLLAIALVVGAVALFIAALPYLIGGAVIIAVIFIVYCVITGDSSYKQDTVQYVNKAPQHGTMHRSGEQQQFHNYVLGMVQRKSTEVNLSSLRPELDTALYKIVAASQDFFGSDFTPVVTSGKDSHEHNPQSAHHHGAAVDLRTKNIPPPFSRREFAARIADILGPRFTVIFEDAGQSNEHLHVQLNRNFYNANEVWR